MCVSMFLFFYRDLYQLHLNVRVMVDQGGLYEVVFRPSDVGLQSSDSWELLVNTDNCKIPEVDPFDPAITRFLDKRIFGRCNNAYLMTFVDAGVLYLNQSKIPKEVNYCKLFPIYRKGTQFRYGNATKFNNYILLKDEFVKIECYNSTNSRLFANFHMHFFHKSDKMTSSNVHSNTSDRFNVILLMLDSTSRVNSKRYLQRTRDYLSNKLNAIELLGYTKVGDNTLPNMTPFLTGKHLEDSPCMRSKSGVDNCTFVWKEYKQNGFVTHFGEDWPYASTFEFNLKGFKHQPTEYYDRPFYVALEQETPSMYEVCFYGREGSDFLNQRMVDIAENLNEKPYFSLNIHSRMTHNELKGLSRVDNMTVDKLSYLYEKNLLNNTIVAFFGDHGLRFGPVRQTFIGQLEERLPMMFLYLPDSFKKKYNLFAENLRTNSRRLTTHFDMHATLLHLLRLNELSVKTKWGISLFDEIPNDRTCENAGIKSHWCTCNYHMQGPDNSTMKNAMGKHFVGYLNKLTLRYQQKCARLNVTSVISSVKLLNRGTDEGEHRIMIRTEPGGGVFEATIQYKNQSFSIVNDISRVNKYAGKSNCIRADRMMKKICYCF